MVPKYQPKCKLDRFPLNSPVNHGLTVTRGSAFRCKLGTWDHEWHLQLPIFLSWHVTTLSLVALRFSRLIVVVDNVREKFVVSPSRIITCKRNQE